MKPTLHPIPRGRSPINPRIMPVNEGSDRVIIEMPVGPSVRELFGSVHLIGNL